MIDLEMVEILEMANIEMVKVGNEWLKLEMSEYRKFISFNY